ncbi:hypothetical protein BHYA_0048g00340 [Botrytis hyacinthi]|uniref:Uncharacterized protein n=1 Tax=Botrytis hyacinthi TaxID=278943 RepID=A0A4Z1GVS1_9HELO|nr:hypothetical protein BHYA_0048g00340 [Botrytis hyacinthi]
MTIKSLRGKKPRFISELFGLTEEVDSENIIVETKQCFCAKVSTSIETWRRQQHSMDLKNFEDFRSVMEDNGI